MERLQKVIAQCGYCSRRKAEEYIASGKVTVNGLVVKELGTKVDASATIIIDGKRLKRERLVYYILNKPIGYVTTIDDPEGRKTVNDLMTGIPERVFPVGRLDYNTSGLLIMTNDGDIAQKLAHPKFKIPKTYFVKVKKVITMEDVKKIEAGVEIEPGVITRPCKIKLVSKENDKSKMEVTIWEGKNRQIRKMFENNGYGIMRLSRIKYGNLKLTGIRPGEFKTIHKSVLENILLVGENND